MTHTELTVLLHLKTFLELLLVLVGLVPNALTRSTLEINNVILRHIYLNFGRTLAESPFFVKIQYLEGVSANENFQNLMKFRQDSQKAYEAYRDVR
jgi:hypothetical protein